MRLFGQSFVFGPFVSLKDHANRVADLMAKNALSREETRAASEAHSKAIESNKTLNSALHQVTGDLQQARSELRELDTFVETLLSENADLRTRVSMSVMSLFRGWSR